MPFHAHFINDPIDSHKSNLERDRKVSCFLKACMNLILVTAKHQHGMTEFHIRALNKKRQCIYALKSTFIDEVMTP